MMNATGMSPDGEAIAGPLRDGLALLDAGLSGLWAADEVWGEIADLEAEGLVLPERVARAIRRWAALSERVRLGLLAVEAAHGDLRDLCDQLGGSDAGKVA